MGRPKQAARLPQAAVHGPITGEEAGASVVVKLPPPPVDRVCEDRDPLRHFSHARDEISVFTITAELTSLELLILLRRSSREALESFFEFDILSCSR